MNLPSLAVLFTALAVPLSAQQFELNRKRHVDTLLLPVAGEGVTADVDGDGDVDILLRSSGALLLNDGRLGFAWQPPGTRIPLTQGIRTPVYQAADVDGDGDIDLVSAQFTFAVGHTQIMLLAGNGTGSFGTAQVAANAPPLSAPAMLRDVDGDNLPDLFVVGGGTWLLYHNNGNLTFTDVTASNLPPLSTGRPLEVVDVDGDGDMDIVCNSPGNQLALLLNDGTGHYTFAPPGSMPTLSGFNVAHAGDCDGDGDQDLLLVPTGFTSTPQVLQNDGSGRFQLLSTNFPYALDGALFRDLDGDGDADVLLVARNLGYVYLQAWASQAGQFVPQAQVVIDEGNGLGEPALADLDGDGDLDVVIGGNLIYLGTGAMHYAPLWANPVPWRQGAADGVAGDFDGDGDIDLFAGAHLLRNDGGGTFAVESGLPDPLGVARAAFDADLDGIADVCWNGPTTSGVLLGQPGNSFFAAPPLPAGGLQGRVAVADFDGDGLPDLCSESGVVLHNLGGATFAAAVTLTGSGPVVAGDLDGDGRADVLFGDGSLWRNTGNLQFQLLANTGMQCDELRLADFDGDGDLDVVGLQTVLPLRVLQVWSNLGGGGFAVVQGQVLQGAPPRHLAVGDFDGDGAPDLATNRHAVGSAVQLWHNDGTGLLVEVTATQVGNQGDGTDADAVQFADIDQDGDLDLLAVGRDRVAVFANRQRQLVTPRLPILGQYYDVELAVQAGYGPGNQLVLPLLALRRTAPMPLSGVGVLQLPPASLQIATVAFTGANRLATVRVSVPLAPALAGLELCWQGLVFEAGGVRLTGLAVDRILP